MYSGALWSVELGPSCRRLTSTPAYLVSSKNSVVRVSTLQVVSGRCKPQMARSCGLGVRDEQREEAVGEDEELGAGEG